MRKKHRWGLAYANGHLYARCDCGWVGVRRPLADIALGSLDSPVNQPVLRAAERDGVAHAQDIPHNVARNVAHNKER